MMVCTICGNDEFKQHSVLWSELMDEWPLSPEEACYIERQKGLTCNQCSANLRGVVLGAAIRTVLNTKLPLVEYVRTEAAQKISVLDMNGTSISSVFARLPNYIRADYPEVDMQAMPYTDGSFDLVVHSDTLEHVPNPTHALVECRRVLRAGGHLCYTVPIIVGRMTRNRTGLPPSYHGKSEDRRSDYLVHTEFGADAWCYPLEAGFSAIKLSTLLYPAAIVVTAER